MEGETVRPLLVTIGCIFLLATSFVSAQNGTPQQGDPPVASLITISEPDADGLVTISGPAGAVFPGADVAIRNLYTEEVVYTTAGITGAFSARIYGPGQTPFWVSPAEDIDAASRGKPGSLPGGPGTIVYGNVSVPPLPSPITQLRIDGQLSDWVGYQQAALGGEDVAVWALRNNDSLYIALDTAELPEKFAQLSIAIIQSDTTYSYTLDPRVQQGATLSRLDPRPSELDTLPAVAAVDTAIEVRIPLTFNTNAEIIFDSWSFLDDKDRPLMETPVGVSVLSVEEFDGIVYPSAPLGVDAQKFYVAGPLGGGSARWWANGRASTLQLTAGDDWTLELNTVMEAQDLSALPADVRMVVQLGLQPVTNRAGEQVAGGVNNNSGWSSVLTRTGLAIDNIRGDFVIAEAVVQPQEIVRRGDKLFFPLRFTAQLPPDLPNGLYVPHILGFVQVGDNAPIPWHENNLLGTGDAASRVRPVRLPLTLTAGTVENPRLLWALFFDQPSDGSRGILPQEDAARAALSNRVRFNSPTYILPPGTYPIEPYLPSQMPNAYDSSGAGVLPLLLPGGRLSAAVLKPDGETDDLGSVAIVQSQLSTAADDEARRFGARGVVDMLRLASLNRQFNAYNFEQYGEYTITLTGDVLDIWGNSFSGGGTYRLLIAELLDLTPGVLSGTPFEIGDSFYPGLHIAPGMPAEISVRVRVWPLDGGEVIEQTYTGQANRNGYFAPDEAFTFERPGEYIIDYEARYTDADGRLWAASLRSAGVIASPDAAFIAHGQRGLEGQDGLRTAWFDTAVYPPDAATGHGIAMSPYYSGDVVLVSDTPDDGVHPMIQVQDLTGAYASWLRSSRPDYENVVGSIDRLAVEDALPLVPVLAGPPTLYNPALLPDIIANEAYGYVSAVRPDVTVRQFVHGGYDTSLPMAWDADDPYNGQIGAGGLGDSPGDYAFIFGGAVIRNAEAGIESTAIYASLAVTVPEDRTTGVYPPFLGQAGGGSAGPLMTIDGEPIEIFFHPTGTRPGDILVPGDTLAIAGQVAPTLPANVSVRIISPSGQEHTFSGVANAIGYYYDPSNNLQVDEIGVWTVELTVQHTDLTSMGQVEPPYPQGGVLGISRQFSVYVVPQTAPALVSNQGGAENVDLSVRPGSPIAFSVSLPRGLSDYQAFYIVQTDGYVLDSGEMNLAATSASYTFTPTNLRRRIPAYDFDPRFTGASGADAVRLTFVVTAREPDNDLLIQTRTFYLFNDRLISTEAVTGE